MLVSYDSSHNIHDEMIFNKSDLTEEQVIWASDLGEEKNRELFDSYRERHFVNLRVNGPFVEIEKISDPLP